MAVAQVVDVRVNPNDTSQRVVLWGNGRVDTINCPDITPDPAQWYDRIDQPVARAIHITDWATTSGYVLDHRGAFHRFGNAPELGDTGIIIGVPYWPTPIYYDWSWDPNNPGRGVVLDGYGTLHAFGGAPTPPRSTNRWNVLVGRRLVMDWTPGSIKAYTLDYQGGIHADYAAVAAGAGAPFWPGQDIARDLVISNWSTGAGWTLDWWGGVHQFGGAAAAFGNPYLRGADWARRLLPLSLSNPLRFLQVWSGGQEFEWVASTAPTVVAGGFAPLQPPSTVNTTTRPMLAWAYTDAQNDSQDEWELAVFTQAYATANPSVASNPWAHQTSALVFETGRNPNTRGIVSPFDLGNDTYRMYVRVKDTAGQWSAWVTRGWTQDVPVPATPTGLTATANNTTASIALSVTAPTGGVATLVRFDYTDDWVTWYPVRGAEAVPIAATTQAIDLDPRPGVPRTYRAVAYSDEPRVTSEPSALVAATMSRREYLLTALDDPTLGGEIRAAGPLEWTRPVTAGVFEGLGAEFPTVVSDGSPKARRLTLNITAQDRAQWETVEALAEADSVLLLRDPFGEAVFCRLVGNWTQRLLEATALAGEDGPLRHMHSTSLPLVEVAPPHEPV